jgi:cobalt-zinc-cadmium efflux system outer membrane protein
MIPKPNWVLRDAAGLHFACRIAGGVNMRRLPIIFLLCALPLSARAETLTLTQVVQNVEGFHPAIKQARWDVKAAQAAKTAQAWLPNPDMGVMFEEVPLRETSLGNSRMTSYYVSQEIPFPTKLTTKAKALSHEVQAKKELVNSAERTSSFDTKKTYFELVAAQHQNTVLNTMTGYYDRMIASLEGNYGSVSQKQTAQAQPAMTNEPADMGGASGLSDIYMAKMKRSELQSQIHDLHHKQQSLIARLNLMMGRDPDAPLTVTEPKLPTLKWDIATLETKLTGQNSDLRAMAALVAKAKTEVSLAKQSYLPDVTPEAEYNQRQDMENAYSMTLNFNVPLWFHKNAAEVKQAYAQEKSAQKEYESQQLNARADLRYLWEHAHWHRQILGQYRGEIIPFARSAADTALTDYQINREAVLASSTLTSLINYHQAQVMYWDMWQDYMTEYAMLERLVGEDFSQEVP